MTEKTLEQASELRSSIQQTEYALDSINDFIQESEEVTESKIPNANQYNLHLCEDRDGSGASVDLSGYHNNSAILESVQVVLEKRLEEYRRLFANL